MRIGLASYWTAGIAWGVITALHVRWLVRSAHAGEVVSGYGAGLIVLGVLIAGRFYLREGVAGAVESMMPPRQMAIPSGERDDSPTRQALRAKLKPAVIVERYVGVAVVLLDTFLNGYGTPLARRWGLPI